MHSKLIRNEKPEKIKLQQKLQKREVRAKIVGTAKHDQIKLQQNCIKEKYAQKL